MDSAPSAASPAVASTTDEHLENRAWDEAVATGTAEAYLRFIARFPASLRVTAARMRAESKTAKTGPRPAVAPAAPSGPERPPPTRPFLDFHIRRLNRRRIGCFIGYTLALILFVWATYLYVLLAFRGAITVDPSYFDHLSEVHWGHQEYIKVVNPTLSPHVVFTQVSINRKGGVEIGRDYTYYKFMSINNRKLLVQVHDESTDFTEITGWIGNLTENLKTNFVDKHPNLDIYPYYLQLQVDRPYAQYFLVLLYLGFLAAAFYMLLPVLIFRWHPVAREIAKWGPVQPIIANLEQELAAATPTANSVVLSKTWLLITTSSRFILVPADHLVWVYRMARWKKKPGTANVLFIGHSVQVHDASGRQLSFKSATLELSAQWEERLQKRVPWAVVGWSKEAARKWKWNKKAFINLVASRREQYFSAAADSDAEL